MPVQPELRVRNAKICIDIFSGKTKVSTAKKFGISATRCSQIVDKMIRLHIRKSGVNFDDCFDEETRRYIPEYWITVFQKIIDDDS